MDSNMDRLEGLEARLSLIEAVFRGIREPTYGTAGTKQGRSSDDDHEDDEREKIVKKRKRIDDVEEKEVKRLNCLLTLMKLLKLPERHEIETGSAQSIDFRLEGSFEFNTAYLKPEDVENENMFSIEEKEAIKSALITQKDLYEKGFDVVNAIVGLYYTPNPFIISENALKNNEGHLLTYLSKICFHLSEPNFDPEAKNNITLQNMKKEDYYTLYKNFETAKESIERRKNLPTPDYLNLVWKWSGVFLVLGTVGILTCDSFGANLLGTSSSLIFTCSSGMRGLRLLANAFPFRMEEEEETFRRYRGGGSLALASAFTAGSQGFLANSQLAPKDGNLGLGTVTWDFNTEQMDRTSGYDMSRTLIDRPVNEYDYVYAYRTNVLYPALQSGLTTLKQIWDILPIDVQMNIIDDEPMMTKERIRHIYLEFKYIDGQVIVLLLLYIRSVFKRVPTKKQLIKKELDKIYKKNALLQLVSEHLLSIPEEFQKAFAEAQTKDKVKMDENIKQLFGIQRLNFVTGNFVIDNFESELTSTVRQIAAQVRAADESEIMDDIINIDKQIKTELGTEIEKIDPNDFKTRVQIFTNKINELKTQKNKLDEKIMTDNIEELVVKLEQSVSTMSTDYNTYKEAADRKKKEEEEAARKQKEEEAARKQKEEEEARNAAEEARKKQEEEAKEEEAERFAEAERKKQEAKDEEEKRRIKEAEEKRIKEEKIRKETQRKKDEEIAANSPSSQLFINEFKKPEKKIGLFQFNVFEVNNVLLVRLVDPNKIGPAKLLDPLITLPLSNTNIRFNSQQISFQDDIFSKLYLPNTTHQVFMLLGSSGSGKTYHATKIKEKLESEGFELKGVKALYGEIEIDNDKKMNVFVKQRDFKHNVRDFKQSTERIEAFLKKEKGISKESSFVMPTVNNPVSSRAALFYRYENNNGNVVIVMDAPGTENPAQIIQSHFEIPIGIKDDDAKIVSKFMGETVTEGETGFTLSSDKRAQIKETGMNGYVQTLVKQGRYITFLIGEMSRRIRNSNTSSNSTDNILTQQLPFEIFTSQNENCTVEDRDTKCYSQTICPIRAAKFLYSATEANMNCNNLTDHTPYQKDTNELKNVFPLDDMFKREGSADGNVEWSLRSVIVAADKVDTEDKAIIDRKNISILSKQLIGEVDQSKITPPAIEQENI